VKKVTFAAALTLAAIIAYRPAEAQSAKAYTLGDIVDFVRGGVSADAIGAKTKAACISFRVNAAAIDRLRLEGASFETVEALKRACYKAPPKILSDTDKKPVVKTIVHDTLVVDRSVLTHDTVVKTVVVAPKVLSVAERVATCVADSTSASSCYQSGMGYFSGLGVTKDMRVANQFLSTGCDRGSMPSCYFAGVIAADGMGMPRDTAAAFQLWRKSCPEMSLSCQALGTRYLLGIGATPKNPRLAGGFLEQGCTAGDWSSCSILVTAYSSGLIGLKKDDALAADATRRMCALKPIENQEMQDLQARTCH
jgi:TPR repeat protein